MKKYYLFGHPDGSLVVICEDSESFGFYVSECQVLKTGTLDKCRQEEEEIMSKLYAHNEFEAMFSSFDINS